ncbi:MAG: helix-hairpin-helix domain-containing protein, partial [Chloroflexota bacterium]
VQRAGEVIPEVVGPVVSRRTGEERLFTTPDHCPACGAVVVKTEGEVMARCPNASCPAQAQQRLKHFASKGAMDIEGIGEKLGAALYGVGLVADGADFYFLNREGLLATKEKVARVIANMEKAMTSSQRLSPPQLLVLKRLIEETLADKQEIKDILVKYGLPEEQLRALKEEVDGRLPGLLKEAGLGPDLTWEQVLTLEKLADKSISNILRAIEASKERPLSRLVFALGILHVGAEIADILASHFHSLDILAGASVEELQGVPAIGPKIAQSVVAFFREPKNRKLIDKLKKAGVTTRAEGIKGGLPLSGMEFVITGKLEAMPRQAAEARIRQLGGSVGSTVTRKTTYLVTGTAPGSKIDKARSLSIQILDEGEFLRRLETGA